MTTAMAAALTKAGIKPTPRPARRWRHAKAERETTMSWSHPDLGELAISVKGFPLSDVKESDGYSWAQVYVGRKSPNFMTVGFTASLHEDVACVLQARGNDIEICRGNLPELKVQVNWIGDERPQTRQKDKDNLDHFICTDEGVVMQLQTSLVSRNDSLYLSNHELWCLQIVETTEENPDYKTYEASNGKKYAALTLWDSQAYPGADWMVTNAQTAPKVVEALIECGVVMPVVDVLPRPDWDPPEFPKAEGFTGAIVLWFNPLIGARVLGEDMKVHFVPLKGIRDVDGRNVLKRGEFMVVLPKQQVLLSVESANTPGAFNAIKPV